MLYPVNPTTLSKYRKAFCLSHGKDDPTNAELALEMLIKHRDKLTALHRQSASMRTLQRLVEQRRALVDDILRITNRVTEALKQYFPRVFDWSGMWQVLIWILSIAAYIAIALPLGILVGQIIASGTKEVDELPSAESHNRAQCDHDSLRSPVSKLKAG